VPAVKALLAVLALTAPAHADTRCAALPDALAGLLSQYAETPRASALMANGQLLVITANDAGGWSALFVSPDGQACMAASGEGFGLIEPEPAGVDG
jgi:hypothetical protein